MNREHQIIVKRLMHKLGLKYNLTDGKIKELVESQWEFADLKMREIPWEELKTEEDLERTKTNFLFTPLGRLYVGMVQVNRLNRRKDGRSNEYDTGRCIGSDKGLPSDTVEEQTDNNS